MTDHDTATNDLDCTQPDPREAIFVCCHLFNGTLLGFHWASDPDDPDTLAPTAWCDACEGILRTEGEWSDRAMEHADLHLVCYEHYDRLRRANWRQDYTAFAELLAAATAYLQERQDDIQKRFRIGDYERYEWNQGTGELVFSNAGKARVVAEFQFVGSVSTESKTWMWSWANRTNIEPIKHDVRRVRAYGEQHSFRQLASALWPADEADGWQMTAITAYLLRAQGAYRSPDDSGASFLVMTDIRWVA